MCVFPISFFSLSLFSVMNNFFLFLCFTIFATQLQLISCFVTLTQKPTKASNTQNSSLWSHPILCFIWKLFHSSITVHIKATTRRKKTARYFYAKIIVIFLVAFVKVISLCIHMIFNGATWQSRFVMFPPSVFYPFRFDFVPFILSLTDWMIWIVSIKLLKYTAYIRHIGSFNFTPTSWMLVWIQICVRFIAQNVHR